MMFAKTAIGLCLALGLTACTSTGHQERAVPKIAKATGPIQEIAIDGDDQSLAVEIERLLDARGIRTKIMSTPQVRMRRGDREYTFDEVQTRYVVRVRSTDLDTCMPEGSRQMHFNVAVIDYEAQSRVFLLAGEYGCQNTLVRAFDDWLSLGRRQSR